MDLNPWWFLAIPALFALGWFAARVDIRHVSREFQSLPRNYYQGLNYLLNEQSDKAIQSFMEVARLDPETTDLHFALGSLFRRRGEVSQAIRMHQHLAAQERLSEDQRWQAQLELGLDFLKAGLLDRAEEVFAGLRSSPLGQKVLPYLQEIYVTGREWEKAIGVAREMTKAIDPRQLVELSHFHCEIADHHILHSEWPAAEGHLHQALDSHRTSSRAVILLGDICVAQGQDRQALDYWYQVEQFNPQYLGLMVDRLQGAYRRLGREQEGAQLLLGYQQRHPETLELLVPVVNDALARNDQASALQLLRRELQQHPSTAAMERMLAVKLAQQDEEDLRLLHILATNLRRQAVYYGCRYCGFSMRRFQWNCPVCGQWESLVANQENSSATEPTSVM